MADLGDTLRFKSDLTDGSGVLTNAATVTLTITLPDGTTVTPSVTNPPTTTGKYIYDYVTSLASPAGRYVGQWLFSLAGGATTSYVETFDVGSALVTVEEATAHLRANGIITSEADLEQLQWLCTVATDAVERDLGRDYTRKTITEVHSGGSDALVLRRGPVLSVTSISESGSSVTGFILDDPILYRGSTGYYARGRQNITVTYVVGSQNPPPIVRKVALNVVQGMWQGSQQAHHSALTEFNEGDVFTAQATLTPVEQSAYNSLRAVGVA
jgi:hypothetical protein